MSMGSKLAVGLSLVLAAAPLSAQTGEAEADLNCTAILATRISDTEPGEKRSGMIAGLMYYIGKLEGRNPQIDLKAELKRTYATLTHERAAAEAQRCDSSLSTKGQSLQKIGSELQTGK